MHFVPITFKLVSLLSLGHRNLFTSDLSCIFISLPLFDDQIIELNLVFANIQSCYFKSDSFLEWPLDRHLLSHTTLPLLKSALSL